MLALAVGLVFNVPQQLQRLLPDYTAQLQRDLTDNDQAAQALGLGGLVTDENRRPRQLHERRRRTAMVLTAPAIRRRIDSWLNTPGGEAIDLESLRGKVVLIDFWAYSCINCQRSIPHVVAWDEAYRDAGLEVIGIHSPSTRSRRMPRTSPPGRRTSASTTRWPSTTTCRRGRPTGTATGPRTT